VYNYQSRKSIASISMDDEVLCCSLHPGGSQLLLGMLDRLRLYTVALVGG